LKFKVFFLSILPILLWNLPNSIEPLWIIWSTTFYDINWSWMQCCGTVPFWHGSCSGSHF
jgi:hypothetical protein